MVNIPAVSKFRYFNRLFNNTRFIDEGKICYMKTLCRPNFINNDKEEKIIRNNIHKKLAELLKIKPINSLDIVTKYKGFLRTQFSHICKNYEICIKNKLSIDIIMQNSFILIETDLQSKIDELRKLPFKLNDTLPLVTLSVQKLRVMCSKPSHTTKRIHDLCELFSINVNESCEIIASKTFLLSLDLNHLLHYIDILTGVGISKDQIRKDMWIFKYSLSFIENRLQLIKNHKVESIKTWMIRCPEGTLYRHIKRESDNRDILGDNSVAEYLSERLKCSENVAKYLIRKQPALQSKSLLKLNEMIDFLYKHGFTPDQICRVPKVLLHSTKTAESRIKELTDLGKKTDSLYILTKSQKQYMQLIENLKKNTKRK